MIKTVLSKSVIIIMLNAFFFNYASAKQGASLPKNEKLYQQAVEESLIPIRPGIHGERPFWNTKATQFISVPSFDFKPVEGAAYYRFTAVSDDGEKHVFEAEKPWAPLTPIWAQLPVGDVSLTVEGLDAKNGKVLGIAGKRKFLRAWVFQGRYHEPVMDYKASAKLAMDTLMHEDFIQAWKDSPNPDRKLYWGWVYPAKIVGALIQISARYVSQDPRPADADTAMAIGKNAADYLISISYPKGTPMEYFPPTYYGVKGKGEESHMDDSRNMLIYPAEAAMCYLDFYDASKDKKYLDAAVRIADTYQKIQLPSGTWYQFVDGNTGKPVAENLLIPNVVIELYDRLIEKYGMEKYKAANEKAIQWVYDNPVKTFNWQGQFEDQMPRPPYENLTLMDATRFAMRLLEHADQNPENVKLAEELMRFVEDQFIVWGTTEQVREKMPRAKGGDWLAPSGLEQYTCYAAISGASSMIMDLFIKAYEVTGKEIYLEKAKTLADALTVGQEYWKGRYPTWFRTSFKNFWINCDVTVIDSMMNLGNCLSK